MADFGNSLTGVWHGLYSYVAYRAPVYFVATLIHSGTGLFGTTHESEVGEEGAPLTLFAAINGSVAGSQVDFTKTYDGSGGWQHVVNYDGDLSTDKTEIEGAWTIPNEAAGRFLMIRSRGATESVIRKAFQKA
jgi:hypothetical protein